MMSNYQNSIPILVQPGKTMPSWRVTFGASCSVPWVVSPKSFQPWVVSVLVVFVGCFGIIFIFPLHQHVYSVCVSQLIHYARACTKYQDYRVRQTAHYKTCSRDIKERNWCQHLKSYMGDTTILSIPTRIISDVTAKLTNHKQTFKIPVILLSRQFPFSLVPVCRHGGETCLPCNAYFPRMHGCTLSFRVHVSSSKHHSNLPFVYHEFALWLGYTDHILSFNQPLAIV